MKFLDKFKSQDALAIFLILECLAICSFALGGINYIFYALGIVVGVMTILFTYNRFKGENFKSLILFMLPMFGLSILVSFGTLFSPHIVENILLFLAINIFMFLGIASRKFENFKPDIILIVIGAAIALLLLISMFATWIEYGLFYVARFKNTPIYYYKAATFDVTKEGLFLVGFKFKEVSLDYSVAFAVILCCYLLALIFISPKENKRKFIIYAALGSIGLIYILTLPYFKAFIFLVPALAIALIYRFIKLSDKHNDIINYVLLGITALAIIFFLFAFLNATGNPEFNPYLKEDAISSLSKYIADGGDTLKDNGFRFFIYRIFNGNRIMAPINQILGNSSYKQNFFGFTNIFDETKFYYDDFKELQKALFTNSKMFEIELVKEGGILAVLFMVFLIVSSYAMIRKYMKSSKDEKHEKIVLVSIILSYVFFKTFENDSFPIIHEPDNYYAFMRNPLTLVVIFLLGMTFVSSAPLVKKEPAKEKVEESHEEELSI